MAFTMIYNGEEFTADRGVKGADYVRLLNGTDVVFEATGVSDFGVFEVTEGSWETPVSRAVETVMVGAATGATAGTITLNVPSTVRVESGLNVSFQTPCDCTAVTSGLVIAENTYQVVDAMGNVMTGGSGVWAKGALVTVVLDVENKKAYIQNPAQTKIEETKELYERHDYVGTGTVSTNNRLTLPVEFTFRPKIITIQSHPTGTDGEHMDGLDYCQVVVEPNSGTGMCPATFMVSDPTSVGNVNTVVLFVEYKVYKQDGKYFLQIMNPYVASSDNNRPRYIFNRATTTYTVVAIG